MINHYNCRTGYGPIPRPSKDKLNILFLAPQIIVKPFEHILNCKSRTHSNLYAIHTI